MRRGGVQARKGSCRQQGWAAPRVLQAAPACTGTEEVQHVSVTKLETTDYRQKLLQERLGSMIAYSTSRVGR